MKIVEYISFITSQFKDIKEQFKMNWDTDSNQYIITLSNDKVLIKFFTERREEDIGITLRNKELNEFYYDFPSLKGFENFDEGLTEIQLAEEETFANDIEATVFLFRTFLENHCQDMLSGDFSQVGPGLPN
jgi:hypothetical protein